jgi:hypothetical protein
VGLKSLLRYLFQKGMIAQPLANGIPSIRRHDKRRLPRSLSPERLQAVLAGLPVATPTQRRNKAMMVLMARLCEPDEGTPARWHWFSLKPEKERPLFAFAGIYRRWKGSMKKDGPNVDIEVFSFMTSLPNRLTAQINHERSPVLLTEEDEFKTWLTGTTEEAMGLVKPFDPDRMAIVQSGFEKKDLLAAA